MAINDNSWTRRSVQGEEAPSSDCSFPQVSGSPEVIHFGDCIAFISYKQQTWSAVIDGSPVDDTHPLEQLYQHVICHHNDCSSKSKQDDVPLNDNSMSCAIVEIPSAPCQNMHVLQNMHMVKHVGLLYALELFQL